MPNNKRDPLVDRRRPTDAELEAASIITPADVDAAIAAFNLHAPAEARGLLEAKPD